MDYKNELHHIIKYIEKNDELLDYLSAECAFDVGEPDELADDLNFLLEGSRCNYSLKPFACDGSGGIYALLGHEAVGYISSEGQAGITAKNIHDFFSILIHCGFLEDFGKFGWLENEAIFRAHCKNCEEAFLKVFSEKFALESDVQNIYQMFRAAVLTQPSLIITATSEEYADYEQIFTLA